MLFARYASYEEQKKCAKFAIDLVFLVKISLKVYVFLEFQLSGTYFERENALK